MKGTVIFFGLLASLTILSADPSASASPFDPNCGYVIPCGPSIPTPGPWNGQLQPTWDVPNWGGTISGPSICYSGTCQGAIPNPNGGPFSGFGVPVL